MHGNNYEDLKKICEICVIGKKKPTKMNVGTHRNLACIIDLKISVYIPVQRKLLEDKAS